MAVQSKAPLLLGIDKLRADTDFSPYLPKDGAPAWLLRLARMTREDLGALAILGPSGVSIGSSDGRRTRVVPDPVSLYIAGLSDRVRGSGQRVAIGIPPSARHIPLLLASAAVLESTLERARGSRRTGGVLVISRDLDMRSRYCDVYVHKELLDDAHPGSRMRPNGEVVILRSHEHEPENGGGVCFFLPEVELPEKVNLTPSLIVLDLRYARWVKRAQRLSMWVKDKCSASGAIALYTIGDNESASTLSQAGFTDIPFDHAAIASCLQPLGWTAGRSVPGVDLSLADAPLYLARSHTIEEISGSETLAELYSGNARLLYDQHKHDSPDLNRARWLLAVLSHMPVPLQWYEITARGLGRSTLKRLIELLGSLSRREKGMGAIVQTSRMHLQQLYNQLEQDNPRASALKSFIDGIAKKLEDKPLLVLVRDRVMAQALDSWLAVEGCPTAEWLPRLEVRSYDSYSEVASQRYEAVIINGAIPRRYRWILGGALGKDVSFVGYPYESSIIERHLLSIYGEEALNTRGRKREQSVGEVLGISGSQSAITSAEATIAKLVLKHKVARSQGFSGSRSIKVDGGFAGLSQAMKLARDRAEQETIVATSVDQDLMEEDVSASDQMHSDADEALGQDASCLSVKVLSRRYGRGKIWLDGDSLVECVRPTAGEEIWRILPRSLRVGDVLLRMENTEARGSLFDQMVQLAEGQPEMDYLASFRRAWREAVQKIVTRNRSAWGIEYGKVFDALKAAGAPISSEQTVRLWMHDQVIGPEAVKSIEAVGKVSGSGALVAQAKRFDSAFRSIRAIHQGIGRRLSASIRQSFRHLHFGEAKTKVESLDDRLGIPLDELIETVDLAEVLSVGTTPEEKSAQVVNRFFPAE